MSFGNYNARHSGLTPLHSFPAYSKQPNSSMMMYRESQISGVSLDILLLCLTFLCLTRCSSICGFWTWKCYIG